MLMSIKKARVVSSFCFLQNKRASSILLFETGRSAVPVIVFTFKEDGCVNAACKNGKQMPVQSSKKRQNFIERCGIEFMLGYV